MDDFLNVRKSFKVIESMYITGLPNFLKRLYREELVDATIFGKANLNTLHSASSLDYLTHLIVCNLLLPNDDS